MPEEADKAANNAANKPADKAGDGADDAAPLLTLKAVRKSYNIGQPNETEVLHGIDLVLQRGEFCAVVGPSGSGKSTLLNIIGLLDRPTSGTLAFSGVDTVTLGDTELTRLRGHRIGFVFQHHHLLSAFTALENVMLPMLGDAGFPNAAMAERAAQLIKDVGLTLFRDQPAGQLSGGQQQRVALARALAMAPALLLADEPTGNLDTVSADVVFALLRKVNAEQRTSVLFVTHSPELAARCDKTIQVVDGQVVDGQAVDGQGVDGRSIQTASPPGAPRPARPASNGPSSSASA